MRAVIAAAILLSLCGCEGGGTALPAPPPPPPMPAPIIDRPPRRVFVADWTGPDLKCALSINGDVPPIDSIPDGSDAVFGTFNVPELAAELTVPGPTNLYRADGKLFLRAAKGVGYPLISRHTFSRDGEISFQGEFTCEAIPGGEAAWGGLVAYNGDAKQPLPPTYEEQVQRMWDTGQWFGLYFSMRDGHLVASLWSASTVEEQERVKIDLGRRYIFRQDYNHKAGTWRFWVIDAETNAVLLNLKTSLAAPINRDPVQFEQDPRIAVFLGDGLEISIGPLDVCVS